MSNILNVKNKKLLEALPNHMDGEVAYCEEEQTYMIYKDDQWIPVQAELTEKGLQLNLYDLNKQIISQFPSFDKEKTQEAINGINQWATSSLYMLYGKEISYFTLFQNQPENDCEFMTLGDAVITLLTEMTADIYAIDIVNENMIEIWIKYEDEPTALYLFNYEDGIVYYG